MDLIATIYMLAFAACGILIARPIFRHDDPLRRAFFGLVTGLVLLIWLPALLAFLLGFTKPVQYLALGIAVICAGAATFVSVLLRKRGKTERRAAWDLKKLMHELIPLLVVAVPLTAIGFILHFSHTITTASDGALHVGQCTFGDLCMHLGFITSISVQQTFPPNYSILPGTPLGYPFLCDSVSSTFYSIGAPLRTAALLPALYAYFIVVLGVYFFFDTWFKGKKTAVLATYLFFIGGGLGFWYFFNNKKLLAEQGIDRMQELLMGWYRTPTNIPDEGLRWVNAIADMLIPQRATLFGWALLFPALQLLYRGVFDGENRVFIPLGILAGAMPLVHTHSFVALGMISAVLFLICGLKLLTALRPGRNTSLAVRVIACYTVILALGILRLLPIKTEIGMENVDVKATTIGCIAFSALALVFVLAALIGERKKGSFWDFKLLIAAMTALICYLTLNGLGGRIAVLCLLPPLVGIAALVLFILFDRSLQSTKTAEKPEKQTQETANASEQAEASESEERGAKPPAENALFKKRRKNLLFFAIFGAIAVALAAPQIFGFTLKQSANNEQFLRWSFNWCNSTDSWLWFYIKNLGLIFILAPVAFLNENSRSRQFYCGGLAIFAVCEILLFQPNPYDNNKLLFVWFALSCGIVAHLIVKKLLHPVMKRVDGRNTVDGLKTCGRLVLIAAVFTCLFLSGIMTLHREYVSADHYGKITQEDGSKKYGYQENGYEVVSADLVELAEWVKANTAPNATFLTDNNHNNAIAMLTGRNIFCGSNVFLYWHGVNYQPRERLLPLLYGQPQNYLLENAKTYGIDYVLVGPYEYYGTGYVNISWLDRNLECVFKNGSVVLYKIPQ